MTVKIQVMSLDVSGHNPDECEVYDTSTNAGWHQCWDLCGGFTVSKCVDIGVVWLPQGFTNEQLLSALIASGYAKADLKLEDDVVFQDIYEDESFDLVDNNTGKPLLKLFIEKAKESK
jgi:hypothetical protein